MLSNLRPLILVFALGGLLKASLPPQDQSGKRLRLATTTSVENSGLLEHLLPHFEEVCGCEVHAVAVGTGQALELGRNGDVDAVIVHAPDLERKFVSEGFGIERNTIMSSDFVILGPPDDPAGVRGLTVAEALRRIAAAKATFVSRGDESGTHHRERSLWKKADLDPEGEWYLEAGQGMGAVLTIAAEKQAYVLTDRGTLLSRTDDLGLDILIEGDAALLNVYSAIGVTRERGPWIETELAEQFLEWLSSPEGQELIGSLESASGEVLFHPVDEGS